MEDSWKESSFGSPVVANIDRVEWLEWLAVDCMGTRMDCEWGKYMSYLAKSFFGSFLQDS